MKKIKIVIVSIMIVMLSTNVICACSIQNNTLLGKIKNKNVSELKQLLDKNNVIFTLKK